MSLTEQLKKPPVLIAGAGIGLVILLLAASRGSGGNGAYDAVAAETTTRLASTNAAYNADVAKINGQIAQGAQQLQMAREGNNLTAAVQAMALIQNMSASNNETYIADREISAGVINNIIRTNAELIADRRMNETRRFLGPIDAQTAVSIAQISSNTAIEQARINAASQQTLANIYAQRSYGFGSPGNSINDIGVAATGIGNLAKTIFSLFGI